MTAALSIHTKLKIISSMDVPDAGRGAWHVDCYLSVSSLRRNLTIEVIVWSHWEAHESGQSPLDVITYYTWRGEQTVQWRLFVVTILDQTAKSLPYNDGPLRPTFIAMIECLSVFSLSLSHSIFKRNVQFLFTTNIILHYIIFYFCFWATGNSK